MLCAEQAVQLHRHREPLAELGVKLVLVGNGEARYIEGFRDKTGYDGEIYTDPERRAYAALGFRRSISASVNVRTAARAMSALFKGARQSSVQGDAWQLGGIAVVRRGGELTVAMASRFAGDHPCDEAILAAAQDAVRFDETRAWA